MREIVRTEHQVWYVPDIEGNRDDPDPMRVLLEPMTVEEDRSVSRQIYSFTKRKGGGLKSTEAVITRILTARVIEVYGYVVSIRDKAGNMKRHEIKDGAGLAAYGEEPVKSDVLGAIRDTSTCDQEFLKNLPRPCDSSHQPIPRSTGDADTASVALSI